MALSQIPTPSAPLVTPETGVVTVPWFQFFLRLVTTAGTFAPGDAGYIVTAPDADLPNARVATDSATIDVDLTVPGIIRWHALGVGGVVVVDPAGALDGDGSALDPLAVRVDGSTIVINGSNQLQATGAGGSWVPLALGVEPLTFVSDGAGQPILVWFTP